MSEGPDHLMSNNPPPAERAGMEITTALAELEDRRAQVLAAFTPERLIVKTNHDVGQTADKISLARALMDTVDRLRREAKAPYDLAVKTVDGRTAAWLEEVQEAIWAADAMIRKFRADARARATAALERQRAEEARLRDEAVATGVVETFVGPSIDTREIVNVPARPRRAPVQPAEIRLPTAVGDYGSKVHDKREVTFTIVDVRKLPDQVLKAPAVEKAMLAAIKQLHRLQPEIEGVKVNEGTTDSIRKPG